MAVQRLLEMEIFSYATPVSNFFASFLCATIGMSTILPLFWDLSCSDRYKRLDTSIKLVTTLQKLQASFESESAESDEPCGEALGIEKNPQEDLEQHNVRLDALNSPDVAYSIRRLLRG